MRNPARPWDGLTGMAYSEAIDRAVRDQTISEDQWRQEVRSWLERAYLAAPSVYGGSGSGGDGRDWERKRRFIAEAIHHDGDFLDAGCANGLLMESMALWAAARGFHIEPYGLDVSPALVRHAAERLPHWADRIFVGDAETWQPPRRFDFVRTETAYAPPARRRDLVLHLFREVVAPGGRLIVCAYGGGDITVELREMGISYDGTATAYRDDGRVWASCAWLNSG